jgi:ethanolamine ammonia-lyase small subunit
MADPAVTTTNIVKETDPLARLRPFTPARIALGRAGTALPTAAHLRFALDHARARDAVHAAFDTQAFAAWLATRGWPAMTTRSAARDRAEYLRRPDLGRRLAASARDAFPAVTAPADVALIAADGLSATALATNLPALLDALIPALAAAQLAVAPVVLVEQGRVAIGDEIGALLGARVAVVLIGERPGLSAPDSLGCYVTWNPAVGTPDAARHCISNIRPGGMAPPDAARAILALVQDAIRWEATGVALARLRDASYPAVAGTAPTG